MSDAIENEMHRTAPGIDADRGKLNADLIRPQSCAEKCIIAPGENYLAT
jgi:hypothetical protein